MKKLNELKMFKKINKSEQSKISGGQGSGWLCVDDTGECWDWVCDEDGKCEWVKRTASTIETY